MRTLYKHNFLTVFSMLLIFCLMWIIAGWNTYNFDYDAYVYMYENSIVTWDYTTSIDFGYMLINELIKSTGATFLEYRQIVFFVFLSFIALLIYKYSSRPILVSLIYFVAVFFRDAILCRNTVALLFLYVGLIILLCCEGRRSKIGFIICILLSCTIHFSFIYYFSFLLINIKVKPYKFFILMLIIAFFGSTIFSSLLNLSMFAENESMQLKGSYITDGSWTSLFFCSITVLLNFKVLSRIRNKSLSNTAIDEKVISLSILSMTILIFTFMNMEFMRLFKNLFIIFLIYAINRFKLFSKKRSDYIILYGWIIWMFLWITAISGVGEQVELLFVFNDFFKLL